MQNRRFDLDNMLKELGSAISIVYPFVFRYDEKRQEILWTYGKYETKRHYCLNVYDDFKSRPVPVRDCFYLLIEALYRIEIGEGDGYIDRFQLITIEDVKKSRLESELKELYKHVEQGSITADEANIRKVEIHGAYLVTTRLPREVRSVLQGAVKEGRLKRMKKEDMKPEVFYSPVYERLAIQKRNEHVLDTINALKSVLA